MDQLLKFLIAHLSFLYRAYGFRFVDSMYDDVSFGSAYLILESPKLRLQFINDRGDLLLDFQSIHTKKAKWFSMDMIQQLITGVVQESGVMDADKADFLHNNLERIFDLFSSSNVKDTYLKLKQLEHERGKRLFG